MRITIITFCLVLLFSIVGIIHMSIIGKNTREQEQELVLNQTVTNVLENLFIHRSYDIHHVDELMSDFCTSFMLSQNAHGEITVNLLGADLEKGILSIEVKSDFRYPNGRKKTVSCLKTVILEEIK